VSLYLNIALRSVLAYFFLLVLTRLMGRKQISQLTLFDYITGITIGSIAATMSVDSSVSELVGLLAVAVWGGLTIVTSMVTLKSRTVRRLVEGAPTTVVQDGRLLEGNLRKLRLSFDEVLEELREKGVFDIRDLKLAVIEPDGRISVQKVAERQPLTAGQAGVPLDPTGMPRELVLDGRIVHENLKEIGLDAEWLRDTLARMGHDRIADLDYAALDSRGKIFVNTRRDDLAQRQEIDD